jgi:hypothetical protein
MGRKMITKTDLEKMLSPLPERTRKQYLDRVLTMIETEKEDKAVFLYIMRLLFHDFVKPIDMMNAISKFVSSRKELGIKSISLDSPETSLANEDELRTYTKIRGDFFRMLDELGLKDEFKDFLEVNLDFLKGE